MKLFKILVLSALFISATNCSGDYLNTRPDQNAAYSPQRIITAVNEKYPNEKTNLIYIGAPKGFVTPHEVLKEVNSGVDTGKVVAIVTALTVKTSTVIVTGNNDDITSATLSRALTRGNEKIAGSKIVYVGGKESVANLSKLASNANVAIEFIDTP